MKWLHSHIATAPYEEANRAALQSDEVIVDVRDLVDKVGNDVQYIGYKINEALEHLANHRKVVICCDYGMSRSNSIAIGVLVKWLDIPFDEAVAIAKKVVDESVIKIEVLNAVYAALHAKEKGKAQNGAKRGNICITGAGGFLGRNLVKAFGSDRQLYCTRSKDIDLKYNVLDLDLLVKSKDIGIIVHLANPKVFTNTEAIGDTLVMLKNVLDVCRTNGVKLVYPSGWEIYSGYKSTALLANEELKPYPKGTYGETKWLCELLIKQYAATYGIDYQIIRSGPIYGAGGEKPKFIYNFIDKALRHQRIVTHRYLNGSPSLDLLHIDDLTAFLVKCIPSGFSGDINIGTGIGTSTFDIARLICKLTGSKSVVETVGIEDYSSNIIMDNKLAASIFGWSPGISINAGIKELLEKYKL